MGDRVTIDLLDGTGYQEIVQPDSGLTVLDGLVGFRLPYHDVSESKSIFIPTALISQITVESSAKFDPPGFYPTVSHTH